MLEEAIKYLVGLGKTNAGGVVACDREPAHVYLVRRPDGTIEKQYAEQSPLAAKAHGLATLVEMASPDLSDIWYSRTGVVLVLDRETRRDRVTLDFGLSPQVQRLRQLADQQPGLSQQAILRELRITFRDCLAQAGQIVPLLRRVNFKSNEQGESEVQQGKVSLGKSLSAQITGTDILPEYLTLDVPVFTAGEFRAVRAAVTCALEPDPMSRTFQLIPLPGHIEDAVAAGEAQVGTMIRELLGVEKLDLPVLYGSP